MNRIVMTSPVSLLKGWGIFAKKELGQNFLTDPSTAAMIIRRARILPEDVILEIGAGTGVLTVEAAKSAKMVYAVEIDRKLTGLLRTELTAHGIGNVEVFENNILDLDLRSFSERAQRRLIVLGNLPYPISSRILFWLIAAGTVVDRAILMFQRELAERLAAGPGGRDYGRISVMLQYCADVRKLASIPPHLFFPSPKVDSQVLEIAFHQPRPEFPARDETILQQIVAAAFSKRRKTLKNALAASALMLDAESADRLLAAVSIDPNRRAETLAVQEFVRLSDAFSELFGQ